MPILYIIVYHVCIDGVNILDLIFGPRYEISNHKIFQTVLTYINSNLENVLLDTEIRSNEHKKRQITVTFHGLQIVNTSIRRLVDDSVADLDLHYL